MWLGSPRDGSAASTASYSYSTPSRPPSCAGRSCPRVNGQLAGALFCPLYLSYWGLIREWDAGVRMQVLASSLRRTYVIGGSARNERRSSARRRS